MDINVFHISNMLIHINDLALGTECEQINEFKYHFTNVIIQFSSLTFRTQLINFRVLGIQVYDVL